MSFKKILLVISCICTGLPFAFGQLEISGIIKDAVSNQELSFVNIGIVNKNIGTISNLYGRFYLQIPKENLKDSITFSLTGYDDITVPVDSIRKTGLREFQLIVHSSDGSQEPKISKGLVEKKYGINNNRTVIHFSDESVIENDIFEIAQLVRLEGKPVKIIAVSLLLAQSRSDSGRFRINFYGFDGSNPGEKIIEKNIVQTVSIKKGWVSFDLKQYPVFLSGNVVVSIEFIPGEKASKPIYYEVKMGGSTKSFVRNSSLGKWRVPPHHYRVLVTALVPGNKK